MTSLWISRTAAATAVLTGPLLLVYGRSDLGPWSHFAERLLWSVPFSFFGFAVAGYVLAKGLLGESRSVARTSAVAAGCVVVVSVTPLLAFPLLFGLGEACNLWLSLVVLTILLAPAAAFQRLLPAYRTNAWIEFLACLIAGVGASLIGSLIVAPSSCGSIGDYKSYLMDGWPMLFATLPLVVLAVREADAVPIRLPVLAFILAALPPYAAKTIIDYQKAKSWTAILWPQEVWSDFISTAERNAEFQRVNRILPGVPARIGEHWYRFQRMGLQNPMMGNQRRFDRINAIQLDIPADDLDLWEKPILERWFQLNIGRRTGEPRPDDNSTITVSFADLSIQVVVPRGRTIDREEVRRKITRFMENAQVK